jgi:transcriptional regulator with XRE-family HTH domain/Zn-dependent peptidase ImmA (M78 family)
MSIGTKLAKNRTERGLTQESLAEAVGISTSYISLIENGQKKPSYSILIKLANYFDVSIDYFFGTETTETKDPSVKFIENAFKTIDRDKRQKVVSYLFQLCGVKQYEKIPFLSSPSDYAKYLIHNFHDGTFPIDPKQILLKLGVDIVTSNDTYEYEAVIYKYPDRPVLIIDPEVNDRRRVKFTLATLLGHLVIPWHLEGRYFREKGRRSYKEEDQSKIEVIKFTDELLLPTERLKEDFRSIEPSLIKIEALAYEKYDCSLTALLHKFVELSTKKYALVTSNNREITRKIEFNLPFMLVANIQEGSKVDDFLTNPPSSKEFRSGEVDSRCWIEGANNYSIFEESMLDPSIGYAVTLLRFTHK